MTGVGTRVNTSGEQGAAGAGYAVLALIVLGFILRVFHLGEESVWLDEVLSLEFAQDGVLGIIRRTAADVHPPLYYLILHPFVWLGTGEEVLRYPSMLFGTLSLPLIFLIGRELYGREQGIIALLLLTFSPFHIFYSQEARMYPVYLFWICLSAYFLLLALRTGRLRFWAAYSVVSVLSLYTHYFSVFLLIAQNLYLCVHVVRRRFPRDLLIRWMGSQMLILALFAPWLPVVLSQFKAGKAGWIVQYFGYPGWKAIGDTIRVFGTGPAKMKMYLAFPSYLFLLLALAGLARREPEKPVSPPLFAGIALFFPFAFVFLASQIQPAYQIKYLIGVYPFYLLLVAGGVGLFPRRWIRVLLVSLLLLSLAMPLLSHYQLRRNAPWRDVTRVVLMESVPGDVVGFNAGYIDRLFRYYRDLRFRGKEFESYRFPYLKRGMEDLPRLEEEIHSLRSQYYRLWLIQSHHWDSDPYQLVRRYLMDHFPLIAKRPGDPELYLFQLQ